MTTTIPDDVDPKYLGSFAAAIKTNDPDKVAALDKSETVFYIAETLGVDMEEDHPDNFNGNVTTQTLKDWAQALAEQEGDDE